MRFLKRKDAAQRWSRRHIAALAAAAGLMILAAAGVLLARSGAVQQHVFAWTGRLGLAVGNVELEGRERASRESVLAALGVSRGMPILAVDPALAKRRLEALPWVRSAAVARQFPDTLRIRLIERQPLAFWQRQGKLVLIDREGVVIPGVRLESFGNLIVLVGDDAPHEGAALLDMLASEPELAAHVAAAVRVGGRRWNLRLDNGIDIELPEEDAATAWRRLAELEHRDGLLERAVQMVDLRLPDRLVVRPVPEPAKPGAKKPRHPGKAT